MPVRSIHLSEEAYERLIRPAKEEEECFSGVILSRIPDPARVSNILAARSRESEIERAIRLAHQRRDRRTKKKGQAEGPPASD